MVVIDREEPEVLGMDSEHVPIDSPANVVVGYADTFGFWGCFM